jgi:hypothetical protein
VFIVGSNTGNGIGVHFPAIQSNGDGENGSSPGPPPIRGCSRLPQALASAWLETREPSVSADPLELELLKDINEILWPQTAVEEAQTCWDVPSAMLTRWLAIVFGDYATCSRTCIIALVFLVDTSRGTDAWAERFDILEQSVKFCRQTDVSLVAIVNWRWPFFEALDLLQRPSRVDVRIVPSPLALSRG